MTKKELLKLTDKELDATIKIQGTKYDRKRKLSDRTIDKMLKMWWEDEKSFREICEKFNLSYTTVRYNVDPLWRATYNLKRNGKHTGVDHITTEDRIAYKRKLVKRGKVKA